MRYIRFLLLLLVITLAACAPQKGASDAASNESPVPGISDLRFEVVKKGKRTVEQGEPFEISVNNCGGETSSTHAQTETRSYQTELQIDVSQTVAAEIGGSVEIAEAVLRDEIGMQIGVRFGSEATSSSTVTIEAPPNSKIVTTLQWKEEWISGEVSILRPDGTYIGVLPFSALNNVSLDQLNTQILDCVTGKPVEHQEIQVTPEIETPSVPVILPTPTPVLIGRLSLPGNTREGIKFSASQSGTYIFKYVSGAYSTYPEGSIPSGLKTWLTAYRVFLNRSPEWNGIAISDYPDFSFADYNFQSSASDAENKAQGFSLSVHLLKGDYLIFVPVDEKPYYGDNPGEVLVDVYFTP